jgi:hypothetical protein
MFIKKFLIISLFCLLSFSAAGLAIAADQKEDINTDTGSVSLSNPLGDDKADRDPKVLIGNVINAVLGVVGSLALLMFIYGGFTWMTASGNSDKVQKGKNILLWATIGLIVIFTSYALVNFIIQDVIQPSG